MRTIKKLSLLLGALVSLAAIGPAGAAAAEWTTEGEPLTEAGAIELEGAFAFPTSLGTWSCDFTGEAVLLPGDEGEITKFDASNCKGTGIWGGCTASGATATVPWEAEATDSGYVAVDDVSLKWTYTKFCNLGEGMTWSGDLTLTPDNPEAIMAFTASGSGIADFGPLGKTGLLFGGYMSVSPLGMYGFS